MISKGRNFMRIITSMAMVAVVFACASCANAPNEKDGILGLVSSKVYKHSQGKPNQPKEDNEALNNKGAAGKTKQKAIAGRRGESMLSWSGYNVTDYIYKVSAGDELSVSFFRKPPEEQPGQYNVDVLDVLYVDVSSQPGMSQSVTVRPDGKLSFPMAGEVRAKGRTVGDIQKELQKRIAEELPAAQVTLILENGHVLAEKFIERTSRRDTGPYTVVTVRPDGIINLPLVGEMLVTGMTIPDITRAVSKRYDNVLNGGIAVSLNLVTTRENTAILGEVKKPGMYPLYEPRHPLYAIAMAGGELETANLSKIILLKRTPDRGLRQYKLDLKAKHVARARGASPALLEPEDILLVPKTGIANVNKWVQQYIRKLLPVSTSASATYNINNAE